MTQAKKRGVYVICCPADIPAAFIKMGYDHDEAAQALACWDRDWSGDEREWDRGYHDGHDFLGFNLVMHPGYIRLFVAPIDDKETWYTYHTTQPSSDDQGPFPRWIRDQSSWTITSKKIQMMMWDHDVGIEIA